MPMKPSIVAWELTDRRARCFHAGCGVLFAATDILEAFEISLKGEG